ncbi:uncharacterized protein LOC120291932 [Eucalyptus grandis]|uniref:uncharacterized protein LOC120291932 n=1 Tax=Eucalyptus grandis TaxID=71139 RepID=UPI00192EB168|nr:uncharacterized protein LOC120291932 [Eucalyptus grandis]
MENLHHRKIVPSPLCPLCKQEAKMPEHTLLLCPWTAKVWNSSPLNIRISRFGLTRFEEWICRIKQNPVTSGKFNNIAAVLWSVWKERNQFIFSHQNPRPHSTIARAEAITASYRAINGQSKSEKETEHLFEIWNPPPPGKIRINVDASFDPDLAIDITPTDGTNPPRNRADASFDPDLANETTPTDGKYGRNPPRHRAAIACVCRDHRGIVVDGSAKQVPAASASQVEAIAMDETLKFIESRHFLSPQVHSDCLTLVHALKSSTELNWELQPIVSRAQAKLAQLPGLSLAHCHRSSNRPTDWIAKACRNNSLPPNWLSNPPCFI